MNTSDRPIRTTVREAHPVDYVYRRLSSLLIVGAAIIGILSTVAAEGAGLPAEWAVAVGFGAFLVLSVLMSEFAARRAIGVAQWRSDRGSTSMQLGSDPEQLIGRITGART